MITLSSPLLVLGDIGTSPAELLVDADTGFPSGAGDSLETVSSGDAVYYVITGDTSLETGAVSAEALQVLVDNSTMTLASVQRMELQLEACISILLIFLVVGLLNYIYRFFKQFF